MEKGACVPLRVHTIVISVQHSENISIDQLRSDLMEHVIKAVVPHQYRDAKTVYHIQPSGKFVIGGPQVSRQSIFGVLWCMDILGHVKLFITVRQHCPIYRVFQKNGTPVLILR